MNILDRYGESLALLKKPYKSPLSGILSYSDAINGLVVNQEFFPKSAGLVTRDAVLRAVLDMRDLQDKIKELQKTIHGDPDLTKGQRSFLENAVMEAIVGYDMLLDAVWIEAEKGGVVLSTEEKNHLLDAVEMRETELYGPRVSDVPEERDAVVQSFVDLYTSRGGVLSDSDQAVFGQFLADMGQDVAPGLGEVPYQGHLHGQEILWEMFSRVYEIYGETPCRVHMLTGDNVQPYQEDGVHYIPATWTSKQKSDYYKQHNIISHAKICFSDSAPNISVGYDAEYDSHTITFPSSGSYSWQRICELIDHEIGTHYMRNENSGRGVIVKSAGYLQTEEGIAMTNEGAVTVLHLDDLTIGEPTIHHLSTFVGENYGYDETLAIMKAYFVMQGHPEEKALKMARKRAERVKRFHANDLPGANRKDVVYRRGKRQVVDFLSHATQEELQERRDLMYQGKFGEADKDSIESLLGDKEADFVMPLALGKMLYQRSLGVKMDTLKMADKRFQLSGAELTHQQKRKMAEILSFVKPEDKQNPSIGTMGGKM